MEQLYYVYHFLINLNNLLKYLNLFDKTDCERPLDRLSFLILDPIFVKSLGTIFTKFTKFTKLHFLQFYFLHNLRAEYQIKIANDDIK